MNPVARMKALLIEEVQVHIRLQQKHTALTVAIYDSLLPVLLKRQGKKKPSSFP